VSDLGIPLAGLSNFGRDMHALVDRVSEEKKEERQSIQSINYLAAISKATMAREFCARLDAQIKEFDEALDQDHEVGVKLVTFGQTITLHVTHLGFSNPSLIFFHGQTDDGDEMQLIQHVTQISFVLVKLPKRNPDEPKRAFGFEQGTIVGESAS
jgi:hypothetical protein